MVVLLGACGSDSEGASTEPPETTEPTVATVDLSKADFVDLTAEAEPRVNATDNLFKAPYITVKAGTTVTFRNDGRNTHNLYPVVEGSFDPVDTDAFEPGTETTITFDDAGDFPYYCTLHGTTTKGMVGAVRVLK